MPLAQAETLTKAAGAAIESAQPYGLVGILLVVLIIAFGVALWMVARFVAPLLSEFVKSTVSLHSTLEKTATQQAALLDEHSGKLSAISKTVDRIHEKVVSGV